MLMIVLLLPIRRPTYRTPLMLFLKLLGLTVNVTKTKVLFQPAQPLTATAPIIDIEYTTLENVDHFCLPGSKSANIDVEIQRRIRCAGFSYGRLKDRVFSERGFRTATKILVYKAVILTTLLYGCETWVAYRRHVHRRTGRGGGSCLPQFGQFVYKPSGRESTLFGQNKIHV